jgi:hypothetical protein
MRTQRAHSRQIVTLTASQREAIMSAADLLPPPQRYGFILRVENKIALRGASYISDALLFSIINMVFNQMQENV